MLLTRSNATVKLHGMTTKTGNRMKMKLEYTWEKERIGWPEGEWMQEPDKIQWVDEETGLDCLMVRNEHGGNWCGYVGVTYPHPHFGKPYDDVDAEVHGGLTFSTVGHESYKGEAYGICHVPLEGRTDRVYWFGFDCAHYMDMSPLAEQRLKKLAPELYEMQNKRPRTYRNRAYVEAACALLAAQLKVQA